jgi:hypothetical protein
MNSEKETESSEKVEDPVLHSSEDKSSRTAFSEEPGSPAARSDVEDIEAPTKFEEDVDEKNEKVATTMNSSTYRLIGTIVFVVGSLFTFASFAFGAQSLIASLESVQFVSNVVFAKYVHKETITLRMLFATLSIVVGNILVVIFSDRAAHNYTSDYLIHLYVTNTAYQAYLCLAFLMWVIVTWLYRRYYHSRMVLRQLLWKHSFVEPLAYSISSSIIGTQAVLNSKTLALLINATLRGEKNEFSFWYVYVILGTWLVLVGFWLKRLDQGLSLFPPLFIIPVMQVFFVFFAILCGGIYFKEFASFGLTQYIGFCAGVLLILTGVYGLAPSDMKLFVPKDPCEGLSSAGSEYKYKDQEHVCHDVEAIDPAYSSELQLDEPMMLDLKVKPEPAAPKPDISTAVAVEEPPVAAVSAPPCTTPGVKKNRKVVKRPLPPLVGVPKPSPLIPVDSCDRFTDPATARDGITSTDGSLAPSSARYVPSR